MLAYGWQVPRNGAAGAQLRAEPAVPRPAPGVLDGDAKWEHDMYRDYEGVPRRGLTQRLRSAPASGYKL